MSDISPPPAAVEQPTPVREVCVSKSGHVYMRKAPTAKTQCRPTVFQELNDPKPEYYEENGLRKVKPYMFAFHSFAKERWQNRTLLDVYSNEFRDRTAEYYAWAIDAGNVRVNNKICEPEVVIKNGDLLSNISHRHEPPVVCGPIKILYDGRLPGNDGETLVVEKPGSMPVHSTGRYHFNTLLAILKYDYNLPLVHTSNRLDRLTSGVMICSLTVERSKALGRWFGGARAAEGGVHKEYLARCVGQFPDGEITCSEPLLTLDRGIGINVVHPEGRSSKTIFVRLSYHAGSDTSLVHCRPITGRSHQIRVHLQFLGHAIANDPVYRDAKAWGPTGGKGGVFMDFEDLSPAQRAARLMRREMGDKVLARELEKLRVKQRRDEKNAKNALLGNKLPKTKGKGKVDEEKVEEVDEEDEPEDVDEVAEDSEQVDTSATSTPVPEDGDKVVVSVFNRSGAIRTDLLLDAEGATDNEARLVYKLEMSTQATQAVASLTAARDAQDGYARERDMQGVELARAAGLDAQAIRARATGASLAAIPLSSINSTEECFVDHEALGMDSGFCNNCFLPLMKDPRPDQLFLWLHALRYKTTEFDFQSEKPAWAADDWEPIP